MIRYLNSQTDKSEIAGRSPKSSQEISNQDFLNYIRKIHEKLDENIQTDYDLLLRKKIWKPRDVALFLECSVGHI